MTNRVLTTSRWQTRARLDGGIDRGAGKMALLVSTSVLALSMAGPVQADDCAFPLPNGGFTDASCTLEAGTTEGVSIVQYGFASQDTMTLENDATLAQDTDTASSDFNSNALLLELYGLNGTTDGSINGSVGPEITVTNNGDITASGTGFQTDAVSSIAPIDIRSKGGAAPGVQAQSIGGGGGNGGAVNVTNTASILVEQSATQDLLSALQRIASVAMAAIKTQALSSGISLAAWPGEEATSR